MKTAAEYRQERSAILTECKDIRSQIEGLAEGESPDELMAKFNERMAAAQALEAQAQRADAFSQLDGALAGQEQVRGRAPQLPTQEPGTQSRHQYSIAKALREAVRGGLTGLEAEVSRELELQSGRSTNGFLLPLDLAVRGMSGAEQRSLNLTTGSGVVEQQHVGFVDLLRNKMLIAKLGATVLSGLSANVRIPKMTSGTVASFKAPMAAADLTNAVIDKIDMGPKRITAATEYDTTLLASTGYGVEAMIYNDLATALALGTDKAAISGDGVDEPEGFLSQIPAGQIIFLGDNGGAPTWEACVGLEGRVDTGNALDGALNYITTPRGLSTLKSTKKDAGSGDFLVNDIVRVLNSYPIHSTNQVPSNGTRGTGTNLHTLVFGDFTSLLIGYWGGVELLPNPYAKDREGMVRVVARLLTDVGVRHTQSFSAIRDMVVV